MRSLPTIGLLVSFLAAPIAHAQSRDTIVIVSVSPAGNLRYGTPTEFAFTADVTLATADTAAIAVSFNVDDPFRFRTFASVAIRRGTQRVTLQATVPPVDWSSRGARFAYLVAIRPLELPAADGRGRSLAMARGEFGTIRPEYGTARDADVARQSPAEPTYFEFQVEKPVRHAPGSAAPRYPPALKAAGIEGEVLVHFVVDTLGAPVLQTFRVLKSSGAEFSESVKAALPNMKFVPAELRGRKVRQLVQQPFVFAIRSKGDTVTSPAAARPSSVPRVLPPATFTPAPRTGTVRGWSTVHRLTVDSGDGSPARSSVMRQSLAAGRARLEIEPVGSSPIGSMTAIVDSSTGRTTMLLSAIRTATVGPTQRWDGDLVSVQFRTNPHSITDLGAGEPIAGLPSRRYRVAGITETRFNLGDQVCLVSRATAAELWTTTDTVLRDLERKFRVTGSPLFRTPGLQYSAGDSNNLAHLGAVLRVRTDIPAPVRDQGRVVTISSELVSYAEGPLNASLFEPPEGYRLLDMGADAPRPGSDSTNARVARLAFARMVDTSKTVSGVTTTCRAVVPR